jgi:mannose/fructose/N-acetylgalactosamine-specific phosphotransferase system component IIC
MKLHDGPRHPGPWRVIPVDSEFAGLLVAVGFIVMGFVSVPIAKWFLLGALVVGVVVALVLPFVRKALDQAESKRRSKLRLF